MNPASAAVLTGFKGERQFGATDKHSIAYKF